MERDSGMPLCLYCEGENVETGIPSAIEDVEKRPFKCMDCGAEWTRIWVTNEIILPTKIPHKATDETWSIQYGKPGSDWPKVKPIVTLHLNDPDLAGLLARTVVVWLNDKGKECRVFRGTNPYVNSQYISLRNTDENSPVLKTVRQGELWETRDE